MMGVPNIFNLGLASCFFRYCDLCFMLKKDIKDQCNDCLASVFWWGFTSYILEQLDEIMDFWMLLSCFKIFFFLVFFFLWVDKVEWSFLEQNYLAY